MSRKSRKRELLFTIAALAFAFASFAQTSGVIEGAVSDSQGVAMPGVTVTLSGEAVPGEQVAVTLADESYRFASSSSGASELAVSAEAFGPPPLALPGALLPLVPAHGTR